ncbi:MAG TPA: HAD-IIIA family hydrolase, partial [Thermomicrobiales bacterium]|nr:HAD-IIIA family hydrolase [Thermomicrobiales bacterium]
GDTLVALAAPLAAVYARVAAEAGQAPDDDHLARTLAEVAAEADERNRALAFEPSEEADRRQWRDFNSRLLERLEIAEHLRDATLARIEAAYADPASFRVFPEVREALARLRAAGYRLAIVSNWSWGLANLCAGLDLAAPFEQIVASARVGFAKPHPGIFAHALRSMGLPPEAVVHVGDNPIADVGGALEAGVRPILLDRRGENAGVEVPYRVRDLLELVALLESWRARVDS